MARQPNTKCPQAAQPEEHIVRSDMIAEIAVRFFQPGQCRLACCDGAEHEVGVAADVLRPGLDGEVDAVLQRPEKVRCGPGIVEQDGRAPALGHRSDRRNVHHFESQRAGRLEIDRRRVFSEQRLDPGAEPRFEEGRLDPEPHQIGRDETANRTVNGIDNQYAISGGEAGEQGGRRGRQSGW